jgi:glycosyltransferase involved in cell wall biosynthesis
VEGFLLDSFKVALISEEFPPFMFGGIGSVCHDLANALSKKGISTTVFCGKTGKMTTDKIDDKLEIIRLPCLNFPPRFLWFQLQNLRLFSKLLRGYDVLHIVNPQIGLAVAYIGKVLKKPMVTSVHGAYLFALKKYFNAPFAYWDLKDFTATFLGYPLHGLNFDFCLRNANHVAVCSFSTLAELKSAHPYLKMEKTSVIYNGIHIDENSARSNYGCSKNSQEECCSIISYGRLIYPKGFTYLIKAVANIRRDFPHVNVQIFGNGPLKEKLVDLISRLGLREKISISGFVPREELMKKVRQASIAVFPSLHEAQPVAILEAMGCKKPVVAFEFPFSREIISDMHNGLLAKPANVEELSNKIKVLLADEKLRTKLGQNAYEYVKEKHNWSTLCEKYIQLYKKVANFS